MHPLTWETRIPSDMCSPSWETHIPSDMCSPTWGTCIPSDMCSPAWEDVSLVICVPPTGKGFKIEENSQTFQGLVQKFKDFSRKNGIQGLFKTVRTLEVSINVKVVNEYTTLNCA